MPSPNIDLKRAVDCIAIGDAHEAIEILTRLIDAEPRNAEAYRQRALAKLLLKDRPRAISDYDAAIRFAPRNMQYRGERAQQNYYQKQYDLCIEDCNCIVDEDSHALASFALRGLCHVARGDSQAALKDFEAAVATELKDALLRELGNTETV